MKPSFPKPAQRRSGRKPAHEPQPEAGARQGRPSRPATPRPQRDTSARKFPEPTIPRPVPSFPSRQEEDAQTPLLPGIKPVLELLESAPERVDTVFLRKGRHNRDMDRIADLCRAAGVRFSLLEPAVFSRIYSGNSQGVAARLYEAGYVELDDLLDNVMDAPLPLVLALDQVQDPGNAGTLARTLYALGGAGIIVPRHHGVYLGAASAKAAAGALEKLPVSKVGNLGQALDQAKKQGFTIYGAAARDKQAGQPVSDLFAFTPRLPAVLVLGSEEGGMRAGMEKRCDALLSIPMLRAFNSLNVAQAGAIIISSFARHRLAVTGK